MRSTLLLFLIVSSATAFTQNLVPNPGFEDYSNCPGYFTQSISEFRAKSWMPAGTGTPDLFNACSNGEADVPYNWAGVSDAFEGEGFAGIYLWMEGANQYREYLQCRLQKCLIRDSLYRVQFHYRLSSYSKYSIDRVGLALCDTIIEKNDDQVIKLIPTLSVIEDSALTMATGLWQTASMNYRARGDERYLIIGNFFDNDDTHAYKIQSRPIQQDMLAQSAYYYIDGVEVVSPFEHHEAEPLLISYFTGVKELNIPRVLKNVHFEFNSAIVLPSSYPSLDSLSDFLSTNADLKVTIDGHTDNIGSDAYNNELSRRRARTVCMYLLNRGVDRKRMRTYGYGKMRPLFRGKDETARQVNRRVEISFWR